MCVSKGMVRGKRQAVDSVFIKSNASMDSLVEKEIIDDAKTYTEELNTNSENQASTQKYKSNHTHYSPTDSDARPYASKADPECKVYQKDV